MRTSIAILFLVVAAFSVRADEPATVDTRGWKTIPGGPGSGCAAEGSPYEVYVHEVDHLGVRTGRFETADGKRLDVQFRGLASAQSVTDWLTTQYPDPKVVFVTGGSAGAIASPVFASQLARHYERARVVQLGDGAGGYRTARLAPLLSGNLAQLRRADPDLRTCTMPGVLHEVLRRPAFYTTTVDGVPLTKWLQTLVDGKRVENVGESLLVPAAERLQ